MTLINSILPNLYLFDRNKCLNQVSEPVSPKLDLTLVNNRMNVLRYIGIFSIVWGHCLYDLESKLYVNPWMKAAQVIMLEGGRFGTVMFFIISGYYLSGRVNSMTWWTYIKHRFHPIILPWFGSLSLLVFAQMIHICQNSASTINHPMKMLETVVILYKGCVFHAAFWFVPVAIFSGAVLVACKKYIHHTWFGVLLLMITIFYSINLYYGWISVNHTRAFGAYIFFMWVGIQLKIRVHTVQNCLQAIRSIHLLIAMVLFYYLACKEGQYLRSLGCIDAFASLRFSNVLLSLTVFTLMLRSRRMGRVNCLRSQKTVFGVYLVHSLIIVELLPYLDRLKLNYFSGQFDYIFVISKSIDFAIVMLTSLIVVFYLSKIKNFVVNMTKTTFLPKIIFKHRSDWRLASLIVSISFLILFNRSTPAIKPTTKIERGSWYQKDLDHRSFSLRIILRNAAVIPR